MLACSLLSYGCHSATVTMYGDDAYGTTKSIEIFTDSHHVGKEYIEIGFVESSGGSIVTRETLLNDLKIAAMKKGAHALIKVEFFDVQGYGQYGSLTPTPHAKATMIRFK